MRIKIRKGLDIPLAGAPDQALFDGPEIRSVAVLGSDFNGLRARLAVAEGDRVRLGQALFHDKRMPEVPITSPGTGRVAAIHLGARRALQSVVVELDGSDDHAPSFSAFPARALESLDRNQVRENLLASGLWTALRTRPFSRVPSPDGEPAAVFVTAIDTNPLAPDPSVAIVEASEAFEAGLAVVSRLTEGTVYVCTAPDAAVPCPDRERLRRAEFSGPHPAGLVGTHIHFLSPVTARKTVWHIGYQDVIAFGELFLTGKMPVGRVVAIGGPCITRPRLLRTRAGASVEDLLAGETGPGRLRIVSGSVLSGHRASGPLAWLGRYHNQVSVLEEGGRREFLSFLRPGRDKYSATRSFISHALHRGDYALTTTQNGSPRAIVPIGTFERVMPLDILPTPLLKALLVEDTVRAGELGCLELDEEDLALCSFVCNGKYEYGPFLRVNLDRIEADG